MRQAPARADSTKPAAVAAMFLVGLVSATASPRTALALDRTPPVIARVSMTRSHFSPNGDGIAETSALRFSVSERSRVTVRVLSSLTGTVLRTLAAGRAVPAGANTVRWDGKNGAGAVVGDGRYTVRLFVKDRAGNKAHLYPWSVAVWVDTVRPSFRGIWATPTPFSPNRRPDGRKDRTAVRLTLSERGYVNVVIWGNGHARRWRNVARPSGRSSIVWNGRDQVGTRCDDGRYRASVRYCDLAGNAAIVPTRTCAIIIDTTAPRATGFSTVPATPYVRDGRNDTAVMTLSMNEKAALAYTIRNPAATRLRAGRLWIAPGRRRLAWNAKQYWYGSSIIVPNGRYPMRMSFTDVAGNRRWITKCFIVHSFYLVCVDPGHGGRDGVYDSGAVGPTGLRESVVNFDLAYNRLRPLLSAVATQTLGGYPIKVLMTRTRERSPWMTLDRRSSLANRRGANIFVSVHCNAAGITIAQGTETYHREGSARSRRLAVLIHRKTLARWSRRDRGVMSARFYVLRHTRVPAALQEVAFISNPREERQLKQASYRQREALGIRDGIVAYLQEYP